MRNLECADVSALSAGPTRRASQSGVVSPHSKMLAFIGVWSIMKPFIVFLEAWC
jgi:hypothetical protein